MIRHSAIEIMMKRFSIPCNTGLFVLAIPLLLFSCKTTRNTPQTSSRTNTTLAGIATPTVAKKTITPNLTVSEKTVSETKSSDRYPAMAYYGESWNTEHVRSSSNQQPSGVSLNLVSNGSNGFVMPVCGKMLSEFGPRNGSMHTGIDLKLEMNDPVYCAFDGMVRMAKTYGGYGKVVVVRHDNGLETLYGHLNTISVKVNQRVKAGDKIGGGGKTGLATGMHLHFETRFKGEPFNPRLVIDFDDCKLITNELTLNKDSYRQYYKNTQIAESKPKNSVSAASQKQVVHVVKKGDTLYNISRRYGTTIDSLQKLNRLSEAAVIHIGQELVVNSAD